jgi:peptidylprolyl isomerase
VVALAFLFLGPAILTFFSPQPAGVPAAALSTGDASGTGAAPTTLQVTDNKEGSGDVAEAGDTVTVEYVGALQDGTVFDSTQAHGQPFTFTLGAGQVIPGWDQGIAGMKVGGQRTLVIPPGLAYGSQQVGPIPPNSTLIFEVQLDNVQKAQ